MLKGNMVAGVLSDDLVVRFDPGLTSELLKRPSARPFDPFNKRSGKPMQGWILVAPTGVKTAKDLKTWVQLGVDYASSLPAKKK